MIELITVKISANIPSDRLAALKDMAFCQGATVTEALRRAIEMDSYLVHREKGGRKKLCSKILTVIS